MRKKQLIDEIESLKGEIALLKDEIAKVKATLEQRAKREEPKEEKRTKQTEDKEETIRISFDPGFDIYPNEDYKENAR